MKKYLAGIFTFLMLSPAAAGVPCSLPFNLVNGTIADATQVMANYNALVTCLGNAAIAGANNDITSLSGLTTPIPPNLGGTAAFTATAASTGSANAQIVATTIPTFPALSSNIVKVVFVAGFTNLTVSPNPPGVTLNVNATGVKNIVRRTTDGLLPLVGGEIIAGSTVEVLYDGTQYQLLTNVSPHPIGTVLTTISAAADNGFLLLQGQCLSTTTYSALFAKMGSPPFQAPCVAGQFNMPDGRGRVVAMIDSGGSGRITVAGGNFDGTTMYLGGGLQNKTLASSDLPNTAPAWSFSTGSATWTQGAAGSQTVPLSAGSFGISTGATNITPTQAGGTTTGVVVTGTVAVTGVTGTNSSINGGVTQTLFPTLQPTLMLNKQVKY